MIRGDLLKEKIKKEVTFVQDSLPLKSEAQRTLDKKFRLEFNFNSNHIEGNTLSYGETELLLIFDRTDGGHEFREYEEMKAHDVALLMIKEAAIDSERPLTEQFIRTLNEILLVKPFWKEATTQDGQATQKQIIPGQYKTTPNSVLLKNGEIFDYANPADVPLKMSELVKWFNDNYDKIEPLELAAIFHHKFTLIHPFDDGNGRTARLVMNYILLRFNLPMIVIKTDEKADYLKALNHADTGDINYFIDYLGNQLLWSLEITKKAINGEDIDEEGDLDKELKMLTANLLSIPNEYEKSRTAETTSDVLINSLFPLYKQIDEKLSLISELFVETEIKFIADELDGDGDHQEWSISKEQLYELSDNEEFVNRDLMLGAKIFAICKTLKKITEPTTIEAGLLIEFAEYHYTFIDNTTQDVLRKLPYGRSLTKVDRDLILKSLIRHIIDEIKRLTMID